jgi:hypothetical protein
MLPPQFLYPVGYPVTYLTRTGKRLLAAIRAVHTDDVEAYYTVEMLEGPTY